MKIGIIGCAGRMGKMIGETAAANGHKIVAGVERGDNIGKLLTDFIKGAESGVTVSSNNEDAFMVSDMVIDFTVAENAITNAELSVKYQKPLLIGTTGLSAEQMSDLQKLAEKTVIVKSANTSLGINIMKDVVKKLAVALDETYDIEIVEMHHRNKADAPSGTALLLGKAAAEGRNITFDANAVMDRTGKRKTGQIGFASLRGGDVIGDHTVIFAGNGERIEISHKATSRQLFVNGVMKIISWVEKGQKAGKLYNMDDVLGL